MRKGTRPRTSIRRSLTVFAVAGLAAAGLAACGSSSGGGSGKASGTLKIITWVNPPAITAFKKIDAEFEKANPGDHVELGSAENVNGPYKTLLHTTVSGSSADIVTLNQQVQPLPPQMTTANLSEWQDWAVHGVFAPLNGQPYLKDYTTAANATESYQGKQYGVVSGMYQEGVFYNKAIFARYHLSPPTTYSQFLTVLKTLKSHGVTPMWVGLGAVGPAYLVFLFDPLMHSVWGPHVAGGNIATALQKGTTKWTDPSFATAMSEEKTLGQYLEPGYTGEAWQGMPGAFANQKAAMLLDGSWDLATVQKANPKLQVGYFPLPGSNTASDNASIGTYDLTFSILNASPNKALAEKWLAFFSTPKIYSQYVDITGISSSQTSGTFNSYAAHVLGSYFGKAALTSTVLPFMSDNASYWDQPANWPTLQQDVINGSKTPQQAGQLYQSAWKAGG